MGYHVPYYTDHRGNDVKVDDPIWYVLDNKIQPGIVRSIWVIEHKSAYKPRLSVRLEVEFAGESNKYGYPRVGSISKIHNIGLAVRRYDG
jgi:hypothetical protein